MKRFKARVRRPFRQEVYFLLLVMIMPIAVAAVFPYKAIGFRPSRSVSTLRASCAFTTLDADAEAAALAAARSMRNGSHERIRSMSLNLSEPDLPDEGPMPVSDVSRRSRPRAPEMGRIAKPPLPATLAAPAPSAIPANTAAGAEAVEAFSREDMLKID